MVKKYQVAPKSARSEALISKYSEYLNNVLMTPPSVLKNKVANGLKNPSGQFQTINESTSSSYAFCIFILASSAPPLQL